MRIFSSISALFEITGKLVKPQILLNVLQLFLISLLISQFNNAHAEKVTNNFDHYKTGFPIDGAHKKLKCNACHQRGIFKGTPKTCNGCHGNRATIATSKKPSGHVRSTNSCDNCHIDKSWSNAQMDHNSITGSCVACHNGSLKNAAIKKSTHIQSSDRCENCHSSRRWIPAQFFHTNIVSNCISCHIDPNAAKTRGKSLNHVQSDNQCEVCHTTFKTWRGGKVDHSNLTKDCFSCHNGTTSGQSKLSSHIKTNNVCESCHKSGTNPTISVWKSRQQMDHSAVDDTCINCHSGSTTGKSRSSSHIPLTQTQCHLCHTSQTQWTGTANVRMDHIAVSNTCTTCHSSARSGETKQRGKTTTHVQSSDTCDECHKGFSTWQGANVDHGNLTKGCFTCHNGSTRGLKKSAAHAITTNVCEDCHKTSANPTVSIWSSRVKMGHDATTDVCLKCHDGSTLGKARSNSHIPLTQTKCELCHSSQTNWVGAGNVKMDHGVVTSSCISCHTANRSAATKQKGKTTTHIQSSNTCSDCHQNFTTWKGAKVDHGVITKNCYSCHNGTTSGQKKSATHIKTTNVCEDCHKTNANPTISVWISRAKVDHGAVNDTCVNCHSGTTKGQSRSTAHIPLIQTTCDSCHTSRITWTGTGNVKMDHTAVTSICVSCHTSTRAGAAKQQGKSTTHIQSSDICSDCHKNFTTWKGASIDHSTISTGCVTCHNGSTTGQKKSANHPITGNVCEDCHKTTANPTITIWSSRITMGHGSTTDTCLRCHDGSTKGKSKSGIHIPVGQAKCDLCHTSQRSWTGTGNVKMDHGVVNTTNCVSCHTASRSGAAKQKGKSVNHVQSSNTCSECHTSFTTWKGAKVDHGVIVNNCINCHNGSTSGAKKGINHIPVLQNICENCHSVNANPVISDWRTKEKMDHGSATTTCSTCHTADRSNAAKQLGKNAAHIQSSNICSDCHKGFTTWKGAKIDHGTIVSGCVTCHNGSTSGAKKGLNHIPVLQNVCENCHSVNANPVLTDWV
ncbi:hypothetical protein MNBD_GAMMA22-2436, partial [hydrothermal vent metagenome]